MFALSILFSRNLQVRAEIGTQTTVNNLTACRSEFHNMRARRRDSTDVDYTRVETGVQSDEARRYRLGRQQISEVRAGSVLPAGATISSRSAWSHRRSRRVKIALAGAKAVEVA